MPQTSFHFHEHHTKVDVDLNLLSAGNLDICLLQLPRSHDEIFADSSRPVALNALRDLLDPAAQPGGAALQQMVPGNGPVLIVLPEYALGSGDWSTVDALVRGIHRPLVFLSGFGATAGSTLIDWEGGHDNGTACHLAWDQTANPISPAMRVNGGWCWLHTPETSTCCVAYVKNVLEQAVEAVELPDLQVRSGVLHVSFGDLDLFPMICADLIQPAAGHPASPQARIQGVLGNVAVHRPALVVGSLLQLGFNENWAIAINSLLNTVLVGRPGAVALCNIAHDKPVADEQSDKWRSLSGVFAPYSELTKGQKNLPAARALNAQGIIGAVIRYTNSCVLTGAVSWSPYNPVDGALVWRGNMYCAITPDGLTKPIAAPPVAAVCELGRFLKRYPASQGTAPRLKQGITLIQDHLTTHSPPAAEAILGQTLDGVTPSKSRCADSLNDPEVTTALKAGLHALATVRSFNGVEWAQQAALTGQLNLTGESRQLLIWRSPDETPRSMARHLANWRTQGGSHPDLIVVGGTPHGDLLHGDIPHDRRDDISLAPAPGMQLPVGGTLHGSADDITSARGLRRVAGVPLSQVSSIYADYEEAEDQARVTAFVGTLQALFSRDEA